MSKFKIKQRPKSKPKLSTASLPDIVFILLFFFMVVAVMRQQELLLKVVVPEATELQKLEHRSLVNHVFIGQPLDPGYGTAPRIQINDAFVKVEDLQQAIRQSGNRDLRTTTSLKVDREVRMGIVSDVKIALRKAEKLKLNYAALQQMPNN
ncbi:MAG: biopolymer transporter ExbD [Bacteroidota bacterium]